jgi:hypothetical protein
MNWRSSCLKLLRFRDAQLFSGKLSLHFLRCVINRLLRLSESDFD